MIHWKSISSNEPKAEYCIMVDETQLKVETDMDGMYPRLTKLMNFSCHRNARWVNNILGLILPCDFILEVL
jgi:hypothetical protein